MRHAFASTISLLMCAATFAACSGGAAMPEAGLPSMQRTPSHAYGPPSTSYTFKTVDDPSSKVNAVTGINNFGSIVGTVGAGTSSSPLEGYTSSAPYQKFTPVDYSKAQATAPFGLSSSLSNLIIAGYVVNPPQLLGVWAFVDVGGLFNIFKNHKEGKGKKAVTEILGVNSSDWAAGFFTNPYGNNVAVIINVLTEQFTNLKPPDAISAEGTGINTVGDISGWEATSSNTIGFFVRVGKYYTYQHPTAVTTEGLSLNSQDQIVGFYRGSTGVKHGFILTGPTNNPSQQSWQTIDDPNAVYGTVVTGINDSDDICGYYIDASGTQHGFVATPSLQ